MWSGSPYSGGGSSHVMTPNHVSPLQGIMKRARSSGIQVLHSTATNMSSVGHVAAHADVVVIIAATWSQEGKDRPSLNLDNFTDELIFMMAKRKPTVVLLQTAGAVLTPWRDKAAAIATMFMGGESTGSAWASVLFGDATPAGKLPVSFPVRAKDAITPDKGRDVNYTEGLYTSYRSGLPAAFPFGHGLSYTNFTYGCPQVYLGYNCPDVFCVRMNVTNSGRRKGAEVAQAYIEFASELRQPPLVLRGFYRTPVLEPGAFQTVVFSLSMRELSTYSVENSSWIEQHSIKLHIGASSADIRYVVAVNTRYGRFANVGGGCLHSTGGVLSHATETSTTAPRRSTLAFEVRA